MDAFEAITTRRSTRKFRPELPENEKIDKVVEAGRFAPSGGNAQTTHFLVVKSKDVLDKLASLVQEEFAAMEEEPGMYASKRNSIRLSKKGIYAYNYHSPVLIITANRIDYGNNLADCACALENMMIEANELGLGSCWINQLRWLNESERIDAYLKTIGMCEGERVYGALALGYADTESGEPIRTALPRTGNTVTVIE